MLEQVGRVAVERAAADWQIGGRARSVQCLLVRVANCVVGPSVGQLR